jgi:hypothetical protein
MFFRLLIYLLLLRIKQLFRLFNGIDFLRLLFLLGILALVSFMLYSWSSNTAYIKIWIPVHTLIFAIIHAGRKDKDFIRMISSHSNLIFFGEYLVLSLPVLIAFCFHANWLGLSVIPLLLLISSLHFTLTFSLSGIGKPFIKPSASQISASALLKIGTGNPRLFEWNSGIRSPNILFIAFVYLIVVCFSFTGYVAHIGIIVLSILISTFYFQGEPRIFIESFSNSARRFIRDKLVLNFKYLLIMYVPIIVVSLIFQTEMWYLLLLALLIGFVVQLLAILIKYSLFRENADLERNSLILIISVIGVLLPFIWPLPVIIGIRSYRKAIKNLNPYFNDQN